MPNLNGSVVVFALQQLREPSTMKDVVAYIANSAKLDPKEIKESIVELLEVGAKNGFIRRKGGRYFVDLEPMAAKDDGSGEPAQGSQKNSTRLSLAQEAKN